MEKYDNEVCIKKFVEYITKRNLMDKNEDKILTTSVSAASELIKNGFYDVWALNMFSEYAKAEEMGISPQFARGFILNNEIYIPFREENKKVLSIECNNEFLFPTTDEFKHIVVPNEMVIDRALKLAAAKKIDSILGFCLPEGDVRIASFMYLYNQAINAQTLNYLYELKTENIDGDQYTLIKKRKRN